MLESLRRRVAQVHASVADIWHRDGYLDRLRAQGARLARVLAFAESLAGHRPHARNHAMQRPFYLPPFPDLEARPWHDPARFSWAAPLHAAREGIRAELQQIRFGPQPFLRYLRTSRTATWDLFPLWYMGAPLTPFARHCPHTATVLAGLADFAGAHLWGDATFSVLSPGAHLPAHCSADNLRIRCHLPLQVRAPGAWFRVGDETRRWQEDVLLAFDDAFEHEAANPTEDDRIVLIVDFWHPDLTPAERHALLDGLGRDDVRALFAPFRGDIGIDSGENEEAEQEATPAPPPLRRTNPGIERYEPLDS